MNTKKEYIAPQLTVVEFKTERGYASSRMITFTMEQNDLYNTQGQENWTDASSMFDEW